MRASTLAILLLALAACAAPLPHKVSAPPELPPASPSPSPTPLAPLVASSVTFHGGEVGVAYAPVALSATGGLTPYKWSVISGALPGGLTIGNDGSVAGTPTTAGTFSFTIQVADAASGSASLPAASMAIAPAVTLGLIGSCAQYCRVELGCANACGNFGQLTGGAGPFTYSLAGGQLPSGTSLNGPSLSGTFKGQSGWLQFTVQVTDAYGGTASVSPKFWMYDHISLAGSATCYGNYLTGCTARLAISGGVPGTGVSVALVSNVANPAQGCWNTQPLPPPAKSSLTTGGGNVNVYIPPAPEPAAGGYGAIWTVLVTSQDTCAAGTYCTTNDGVVTIGVQCG